MPQLIRLTLTIPQGKSLHICNGQIITLPQMFVSFFSLFVLALFMSLEDHQRFFYQRGWALYQHAEVFVEESTRDVT